MDSENNNENNSDEMVQASRVGINPSAQEFNIQQARSLFFTFSYGLPLTGPQIITYFTRYFGNCVESVEIYTSQGRALDSGKIVFNNASMANRVLNGREEVQLIVGGKSIRLKKFNPRNQRA